MSEKPSNTLKVRQACALAACLAAALAAPAALALDGDRIQLRASSTITYDDNLFRQSGNVISDRIWSNLVGVRLDVPYSRQRFIADLSASNNRFSKVSLLDNSGQNLMGEWDWGYRNDWTGSVTATQSRQLSDLAYLQANTRNVVTQRGLTANADYALDARIKLQGVAGASSYTNGDLLKVNDSNQRYIQLGAAYVTPPGNSAGGRVRVAKVSLPNNSTFNGVSTDNSFRDSVVESYFDWRTSGVSRFSGHLGLTHRDYSQISQRNFTGATGRVQYDWTPNEVTSIQAGLERSLYGILDLQSQFVLTNSMDVRATWTPTPKISAQAGLTYAKSDFGGDAVTRGAQGIQRNDTNRAISLGVNYDMRRWARLGLTYQYAQRSSNLQLADYTDHVIAVNLLLSF